MGGRIEKSKLFLLGDPGEPYLLYAPLSGLAVEMNAAAAQRLSRAVAGGETVCPDPAVDPAWRRLVDAGTGEEPPIQDANRPFCPDRLTVFPTNTCNLGCSYCYAEAGEWAPMRISTDFCDAAIDLVARGPRPPAMPLPINFHGGGEPTLGWEEIVHCVDYARRAVGGDGKGAVFSLATNGVLTRDKVAYLAENFDHVNLSLDGPADIQNRQRPMRDGSPSFDAVMATVELFHGCGVRFSVRVTVTAESAPRMREICDFLIRTVRCKAIHLEPVFECGRCRLGLARAPDPALFSRHFKEGFEFGAAHGAYVRYSGARIGIQTSSFCGVSQDSFSLTPDGYVTACYEVSHAGHPLASQFIYGRYDVEHARIVIDRERLAALRSLVVTNKPLCNRCFCRWHCAGDCPVKARTMEVEFQTAGDRCAMNQTLTRYMIRSAIRSQDGHPRA